MTRSEQLVSAVHQAQFPHLDSLIHLFVGVSELHGAKVKDTDDLDIYGVYLEPPELVLGFDKQDFYVWSTAGNERRNTADDIDMCLYSLRKWAGLAAKGNPTALHFLFIRNYALKSEPWQQVLKTGTYSSRGRKPFSSVGLWRQGACMVIAQQSCRAGHSLCHSCRRVLAGPSSLDHRLVEKYNDQIVGAVSQRSREETIPRPHFLLKGEFSHRRQQFKS